MRTSDPNTAYKLVVTALAFILIGGCGKKSADATPDSVAMKSDAAAAPKVTTDQVAAAESPLTVEDIDRWQRGMDAELQAVQQVPAQMKNAKTSDDSLNALNAANEASTRATGAKAAGVAEGRYQLISSRLSSLAANMTPTESEMDMSKMPASMAASMNQAREQALATSSVGVSPDVLAALKPRAVALRKQALALIGARLKAVDALQ